MLHDPHKSKSKMVMSILLANHRRFLSFLEARVGSRDDAEEILQDAFVRSVQKGDARMRSLGSIACCETRSSIIIAVARSDIGFRRRLLDSYQTPASEPIRRRNEWFANVSKNLWRSSSQNIQT